MVTVDTNIVIYSLSDDDKAKRAQEIMARCDFLSVQVLNEFAAASRRKLRRQWDEVSVAVVRLRDAVSAVHPVDLLAHQEALRLASRYQLSFYDALIIAVATANGADTLYSENMHDGLVIDGRLTIRNPFCETVAR